MMPSPIRQEFGQKVTPGSEEVYPDLKPALVITPNRALFSRLLFVLEFENGLRIRFGVAHLHVLQLPPSMYLGHTADFEFFEQFVVRSVSFRQNRLACFCVNPGAHARVTGGAA